MKNVALIVFILLALSFCGFTIGGCTDKKAATSDSLLNDSNKVDSTPVDTLEEIISEQPMPKAADELFDDFFFNFAANKKLQLKRIKFPLAIIRNGKPYKILNKRNWRMQRFFMRQGYYTLIFDNKHQLHLLKDTTVCHVVVEEIAFSKKSVKQYMFDRINGEWMLTSINVNAMYQNNNASFLKFYDRFSSDSVFQQKSMAELVTFTAPNPDDDFSTITGSIIPEQWSSFKPALIPRGKIYNIIYGQKYIQSSRKIFLVRGVANGMEIEFVFKKHRGKWQLVKFTS